MIKSKSALLDSMVKKENVPFYETGSSRIAKEVATLFMRDSTNRSKFKVLSNL